MSLEAKKNAIITKGCCFVCLKAGHISRKCKSKHKCPICGRRHYAIICPSLPSLKRDCAPSTSAEEAPVSKDSALANQAFSSEVLLQTLIASIRGDKGDLLVRVLIDSGSQRSYVCRQTARKLGLKCIGQEKISHSLFGGLTSTPQEHNQYRINLGSVDGKYQFNLEVLDQPRICGTIPKVPRGPWIEELEKLDIYLTDTDLFQSKNSTSPEDITVLLGADVAGKLLTGKVYPLTSGPVAVQTRLGWTLMGKVPSCCTAPGSTTLVTSLLVKEAMLSDLWKLDSLGISDPVESLSRRQLEEATMEHFRQNIRRTEDGRYEVVLPWNACHPPLPTNRHLAERRLINCIKKLRSNDILKDYEAVLQEWISEGIIEEIPDKDKEMACHYLPHRAVIKEKSQTTKIRPVFDASAHEKNAPSLNDCLEKGPNLIEHIPSILNRFRLEKIGVVSDIKKAFLQISVTEADRDFLRFLWWENGQEDCLKVYRHRRVVFGVSSSPFLLGATLSFHLKEAPQHLKPTAAKLKDSFYVDNCVTSVQNEKQLQEFIRESHELLYPAGFELQGWCYSCPSNQELLETTSECERSETVNVLGLSWNLNEGSLRCEFGDDKEIIREPLTKRTILSTAHQIFDPIGFTCPDTLCPKLLLQKTWELKVGWDDELSQDISQRFFSWFKDLRLLKTVKIPRAFYVGQVIGLSLHVFCDASKKAYATCVFVRAETSGGVFIQLIQAKARVAPLKPISIPRLELLACCIGARLMASVKKDLQVTDLPVFCWSDSANALCWIRKDEQWGVFVSNRVKEIRTLTNPECWRHVPGNENPADLPSRGCTVTQLIGSKWWESPAWLYKSIENWPTPDDSSDAAEVEKGRRKTIISAHCSDFEPGWYHKRLSSFLKILRMLAWIQRFSNNAKKTEVDRIKGELTSEEINKAEIVLWKLVQRESFDGTEDSRLRTLQLIQDSNDLLRVKTSIIYRQDSDSFKYPIVLPSSHPVVHYLILWKHRELCHAGIHILLTSLREMYWILKSRKTIRQVLHKCGKCKRFAVKKFQVTAPPLPENRVCEAGVFEIIGVDLAGPLFLKGRQKAWTVIFTCAIYRAVHLELVTSLSTEAFLQALRRFIARRGRPSTIYSDNGTNFVGSDQAFQNVNWESLQTNAATQRIRWIFNPPAAPWWGGWWERLIRILKGLLRRVLGRACLQYEELNTVLCDCESVINARPLTYVSECVDDLEPLTPAMFLQDTKNVETTEIDAVDQTKLNRRAKYRFHLREQIRNRFRIEYLGQLKQQGKIKIKTLKPSPSVGDIVLVDNDTPKRIEWRLGRVIKLFPGKDGEVRVARIRTKCGEITRPLQKLYPLEVQDSEDQTPYKPPASHEELKTPCDSTKVVTRYGRQVKAPRRLFYT